jgi:photosystem II stability/assembly factor-like uncharacterized protein
MMIDRSWMVLGVLLAACGEAASDPAAQGSSDEGVSTETGLDASSGGVTAVDATSAAASSSEGTDDTAPGTSDDNGGDTTGEVPQRCGAPLPPGLPTDAPALVAGEWTDISPAQVPFGNDTFTQGLAIDPCDPSILYLTVSAFEIAPAGLFKSTNAGASWTRVAAVQTDQEGVDHLDEPIRVRIDPGDPLHLYVVDGVRGATMGFWVSHDGGESFTMPAGFHDLEANEGIFMFDTYDVAVDPTDFEHLLVSSHSPWSWEQPNVPAGVLESKDGGESWIVHPAEPSWTQGHAINFLYAPEQGIGDADTWLLGTQNDGMWRTTDAGGSWTKVTETAIQHGGGTIYYASNGTLYASGTPSLLRSLDNGESWMSVGPPGGGFTAVHGDGELLYTAMIYGPAPMSVSAEDDGITWTPQGEHQFGQGPFELAFDASNRILYSASWNDGLWALKLP